LISNGTIILIKGDQFHIFNCSILDSTCDCVESWLLLTFLTPKILLPTLIFVLPILHKN